MLTAEAHIETERPSRYLVQLCKHFDNKGRHLGHRPRTHRGGGAQAPSETHTPPEIRLDQIHVEWTDTHGTVRLPWGTCALQAAPGALTLRAQSPDEESLRRLQDLVTTHLSRFSRRDPLQVDWQRPAAPAVQTAASAPAVPPRGAALRRRRGGWTWVAAVVALAAVVAVHLGLGGAVLADTRWTGWAVGFVVTAAVVKIGVVGSLAIRRGRRTG
ncbi:MULTISPECIES: DUF2218 domain-containing protein [Streptomyces]|uniref:DUF2218 domain-containing protein n=1 Tax=Streptomyces TaxID=1883 RepID=UPI001C3054DE|nr:DUF2218 domain-containing protein [Streptomyces sp. GbtcB7]